MGVADKQGLFTIKRGLGTVSKKTKVLNSYPATLKIVRWSRLE